MEGRNIIDDFFPCINACKDTFAVTELSDNFWEKSYPWVFIIVTFIVIIFRTDNIICRKADVSLRSTLWSALGFSFRILTK